MFLKLNVILNVINEASKSAMRVGRHRAGVTLSIKNNILNYKAGKKGINGKLVKKIKLEDRFEKNLMLNYVAARKISFITTTMALLKSTKLQISQC